MKRSCFPFYVISLLFLAGVLLLDVVILTKYYSRPEQIKSLLKPQLGDTLELTNAHYDYVHGLKLNNVRLHHEADQSTPFLQVERIRISLSLYDLIRGRTIPSEIRIQSPVLTLQRNRNGVLNVRRFLEQLPGQQVEKREMDLQTNVSINNASITLRQLPELLREKEQIQLTDFDLDVRPIRNGTGAFFVGDGSGTLGRLTVEGKLHQQALAARVSVHSLNVQEELVQIFSPSTEIQEIWEKYRVTGPATIRYDIETELPEDTSDFSPKSQSLTVSPEGMSGSFTDFPYPLENVTGTMTFKKDGLTLDLRSTMNQAEFAIHGQSEGYGDRSELNISLSCKNVPIDEKVYTALETEPDTKTFVQSLNASGTVNATGSITRQEGQEDVDFLIRIHPQGISASYDEFPYPVQNLRGTVVVEPDQVQIEKVNGTPTPSNQTSGDAAVTVNGMIRFSEKENQSTVFDLHFDASGIPLEKTLRKNLPEPVQNTWDALQPQGTGSAQWSVSNSRANASPQHTVNASLNNCILQPQDFDKPIQDVAAKIQFDNNQVTIRDVSGKWNEGTIQLDEGKIGTTSSRTPFGLFSISARNLKINPSLKRLIFDKDDKVSEAIQNQGTTDLTGSVRWFQRREDKEIEYYVSLNVDGMGFEKMLELKEVNGNIVLKGEEDLNEGESNLVLTGGMDLAGMNLNGVPIDSLQSNFILRKGNLKIQEINGRLLNGTLKSGHLIFNTKQDTFDVQVDTSGLNLQRLLTSLGVQDRNLSGTLFGNASLRGNASNRDSWTGEGSLRLRDAQLWKLPLFLPVFMELSVSNPKPFTEGNVEYDVKDRRVNIRSMRFESPSSRLTGKGYVNFDGSISIGLRTKQLDSVIPSIPIVSWVYNQITSSLVTFKATGTLSEPSVSATPLPILFQEKYD